jgi:hypothetical protein
VKLHSLAAVSNILLFRMRKVCKRLYVRAVDCVVTGDLHRPQHENGRVKQQQTAWGSAGGDLPGDKDPAQLRSKASLRRD